jgi:hypothetical protein
MQSYWKTTSVGAGEKISVNQGSRNNLIRRWAMSR